jgi:hypothetical protein
MGKTLRVKYSNFKTPLTYNEWCERYGISTKWDSTNEQNREIVDKIELAKFIQDNPNIYGVVRKPETEDNGSLKKEITEFVSHIREYFIQVLS